MVYINIAGGQKKKNAFLLDLAPAGRMPRPAPLKLPRLLGSTLPSGRDYPSIGKKIFLGSHTPWHILAVFVLAFNRPGSTSRKTTCG